MHTRLLIAAAISIAAAAAPSSAHAAPQGFCKAYANSAAKQIKAAGASERCGATIEGSRWSGGYQVHFDWCRTVSLDAAEHERSERQSVLKSCRRKKG